MQAKKKEKFNFLVGVLERTFSVFPILEADSR